jgi:hypothetical protein
MTYRGTVLIGMLRWLKVIDPLNDPFSRTDFKTGRDKDPNQIKYLTLIEDIPLLSLALIVLGLPTLFISGDPTKLSPIVRQFAGVDGEKAFLNNV